MTTSGGKTRRPRGGGYFDRDLFLTMYLPSIAIGFGTGAIVVVMPHLTDSLGEGIFATMMVFVFQQLGTAVAPLPTGYLIDKIGRRRMLLAGPVLIAISSLLIVQVILSHGTVYEVLIYRFFGGVGEQMWMLSRLTVIADSSSSGQRGKQITSIFGVQQVGNLTGPLVGGAASVTLGLWAPFLIHAIIIVAAVIPSFWLVRETMQTAKPVRSAAPGTQAAPAVVKRRLTWADLRTAPIPQVLSAQFLANVTRGGIFGGGVIVAYAHYAFNMSDLTIGYMRSTMSVIGIPIVFGAGYIMDRYGRKFTIVPGLTLSALSMVFLALTAYLHVNIFVFIAAFIAVHLSVSLISGNMQTLGADVAPAHARGAFFGVSRQIAQTGSVGSPLTFALLYSALGYGAGFSVLALTGFMAASIVLFGVPETLKKDPPVEAEPVPVPVPAGGGGSA